jgi:hypothetical protein
MAEPGDAFRPTGFPASPATREAGVPPRLRSERVHCGGRAQHLGWPAWAFVGLLVTLAGLHLASVWGMPLPLCGLREATGYPCPLCGSTRAAQALAQGDWVLAWRWNPLAAALMLGAGLLFAAALADRFLGTRMRATAARWGRRWGNGRTMVALLLANWLYLLATHTP